MHAVAPLVLEKVEPSMHGLHILSDVLVQLALKYVPGEHALAEHGVHAVAPLVLEKVEPSEQGVHTLSDVLVHKVS